MASYSATARVCGSGCDSLATRMAVVAATKAIKMLNFILVFIYNVDGIRPLKIEIPLEFFFMRPEKKELLALELNNSSSNSTYSKIRNNIHFKGINCYNIYINS